VEEALLAVERDERVAADLEALAWAPQLTEVDRQAERAHDERAVQVELPPSVRSREAGALPEAMVETSVHLPVVPAVAGFHQRGHGDVVLVGAHEQVDVRERAHRGVVVVEARERGPLQHTVLDTPITEQGGRRQEVGLEEEAQLHAAGVGRPRRGALVGGCRQRALFDRAREQPADLVEPGFDEQLVPCAGRQGFVGERQP
jgi:hypothetical protein